MTKNIAKIEKLLKDMTLEELAGQMSHIPTGGFSMTGVSGTVNTEEFIRKGWAGSADGGGNVAARRKMQELAINEGPHGIPMFFAVDVIHGHRTIAPIPLGLSSTWNPDLIKKTAQMAAREARADGINLNWSPMVDICFDGRWGRIAEGSGELRHLANTISEAMVQGYQGDQNDLDSPDHVMATMKHWFGYGLSARDYDTVSADAETLLEIMEPFKAGIKSGAGSLMISFNTISRRPMTASRDMVHGILREDIGFEGVIATDHTATSELINHGVAADTKEAAYLSFKAGATLDLISLAFIQHIPDLVREGEANPDAFRRTEKSGSIYTQGPITRADVEQAVRYNLIAKDRLGLFDNPYIGMEADRVKQVTMTAENKALVRQAAAESSVLLKNEGKALPLKPGAKIGLFGPLAASKVDMQGTWAVSADTANNVSLLEGLQGNAKGGSSVQYAKGCNITDNEILARRLNVFAGEYGKSVEIDQRSPQVMIAEALEVAKNSDTLVLALGETKERSGEASSVQDISISSEQRLLFDALSEYAHQSKKPLVLVTMSGRPLALEHEYNKADAILHAWHGGTEAGNGIADILNGDVNPSGRLSVAFPGHTGQLPIRTEKLPSGRPFHGAGVKLDDIFSKFTVECVVDATSQIPMLPAGFGLSYTSFEYGQPQVSAKKLSGDDDALEVAITIKNTGDRRGKETPQLYIRDLKGSVSRPVRELKHFTQIELDPGQEKTVTFAVTPQDLKFYKANSLRDYSHDWEAGDFEIMVGPNSRDLHKTTIRWNEGPSADPANTL